MKNATTVKLPKKTTAKVNDPSNPAWTENMLGKPVLKKGRELQLAPSKVLTLNAAEPSMATEGWCIQCRKM